jgi:dipeptidyl aminopeptidase/acylaminoacyl peptidase
VKAESTNNDIFTLKIDADPATAKKVSTSPGSDDGPQYSPDGKYLAWRSQARSGYESDKFDLIVMDRSTPMNCHPERSEGSASVVAAKACSPTTRNTTAKFDGWVDEFSWSADSEAIYFMSSWQGQEPVFKIELSNSKLGQLNSACIPCTGAWAPAEFSDLRSSSDGKTLVMTRMSVTEPSEVVTILVDKNHIFGCSHCYFDSSNEAQKTKPALYEKTIAAGMRMITSVNATVDSQLDMAKMESFTFSGANNTKVQGFLIKPPNFDPTKKYPLKFLIHGGPQGAWGDAWSYRWNPELFAANGYVVVMINPRGSTGYGQKFLEQVSGDWGGRPYTDLMKGLDYAEKTFPFIDKKRECALGASYGGFMADFILTHTDRFACIVTHDGMYNPQSAFGTTEELWFNEWEFRPLASNAPDAVVEQAKPAHPWDFYNLPASQDPFRKFSPMLSIQNAKTPTLVIHGQKDYRLDVSEGLQLFDALQIRGVPSKMLYFPDEGHWVLKPQNSQLWYNTVNDWCDQWTHTNKYATTP